MAGSPAEIRSRWQKKSIRALWLVLLIAPAAGTGAEPNRSWDVLMQSARPGHSVVVTRMNSATLEGKLLELTGESIAVQWHGSRQVVAKDDVFRVRKANIRRRNTLLGMAAGAAAGAIVGAVASGYLDRSAKGQTTAELTVGGLGAGALIGGVLPIGAPLYEAERPIAKPVAGAR